MSRKLISLFIITACIFMLCACGNTAVEKTEPDILSSVSTAKNYISGYWTDGRGEFFEAGEASKDILLYDFSYPTVDGASGIYILKSGTLYSSSSSDSGEVSYTPVLEFEYVDENSLKIKSCLNNVENIFIRDSRETDPENLSNDYVFWSARRAAAFFNGIWTDRNDSYFQMTDLGNNNISWQTSFDLPEIERADFCDGKFCSVKIDDKGVKTFEPILSFDIQDKDHVVIELIPDGTKSTFRREPASFTQEQANNDYVFWNLGSTLSYLIGNWEDNDKHVLEFTYDNSQFTWNTNLKFKSYDTYDLSENNIVGINIDKDGNQSTESVFEFNVVSIDEMNVVSAKDNKTYTFSRVLPES